MRDLRHKIAKIEGRLAERFDETQEVTGIAPRRVSGPAVLRTGVERLDAALSGGLPSAGLIEVHAGAVREAGAAAGFVLALLRLLPAPEAAAPLLWIGTSEIFREAGRPYAPGLAARFGLQPENLLIAEADKLLDALWIAEEAARLDAFLAVLLEIRGSSPALDLTATRRLHRRALLAGRPLFLVRAASEPEPTAAPVRLLVAPAPAATRLTLAGPLAGSIGPPAFQITVSKSRTAIPAAFTLEWNNDAFQERRDQPAKDTGVVVSLFADGQAAPPALREIVAFPERQGDAAGAEPARQQHPARRRARRVG
ncbi:hypothetical protein RB623_08770 [Mesorhizobium sp. LHD-90]|uniref:ImuA family protein n=1 Tax=Mesorhizobium sp. LHD-90 TaxID=3071414 RepID=UPI0027E1BB47|nr:hypothetical protein [Mesorhizobium sp. LHD-90]MDQ6434139.1 hypothetical protein [Mesorhizobium sp. LHD-90]